jgi:murein DD-endopeptidase MepM/ murein hydrolase activator NlpD
MTFQKLLSGFKLFAISGCLVLSTTAFSQGTGTKDQPDNSRAKLQYKQTHGLDHSEDGNLFADGFKLKMDISILEEAADLRDNIDMDAIPAEDLYGGIWVNSRVNAYGTAIDSPSEFEIDLSNFTIPAEGHVTSNFGRRGSRRYHYGIDIKAQTGDTIYAAFDGKIRVKQFDRRGYGYYVVIRHLNGLETLYGHMSKFLVTENDFVMSGDPIGLAGNTGRSFGSHLHFETRFLGKPIDPNFIIDFENKVCHRDTYLVSNDSYKKTTLSSRVIKRQEPVRTAKSTIANNNKFVSGSVTHYKIKSGDTLEKIANKNGVSVSQICALNNITKRTTLRIGKSLLINQTETSKANAKEEATADADQVKHYKVRSGDTLGTIAKRNGVSVKTLCSLNNISTRTTLKIGATLRVS